MELKALAVISALAVAGKVLWALYLSPLARQRIPGPRWAAISGLWQYWLQLRRRRTLAFHDLFERYGPVVRVGPNYVAFRNIDSIKAIYSTHNFRKSDWYNVMTFGGSQNMFSTQDPIHHARMRRISAPAFRGENLRAAGPALFQEMDSLIARLRTDCAGGAYVDALQLFPKLTLDVLGLAVLGVRFDQLATGQDAEFEKHLRYWYLDKLLVQPLPSVVRKLPIAQLQEIISGDGAVTKYIEGLYEQAEEDSSEGRSSMLHAYRAYRDAVSGEPAPLDEAVGDLCVMFIAGTETTAVSLVYLTYHLALREESWKIMRSEVAAVQLDAEDFVESLRGLVYLNAFIREILRVHGPVPIFWERVVPAGGVKLDGYDLPEGTIVGGQAYSSHLDTRIFPQPHVVDPLRWVRFDETTGRYVNREDIPPAMNSHYFPFGVGVRSCVGKPLADLELLLITAILVKNFRIHMHEKTTVDSMRPVELLTVRPQATRCLFHFEYAPAAAT